MNIYRFSWCVCSFDQECNIEAKNEEKAQNIFNKEVRDKNSSSVWAAHYASVTNLSDIYQKKWIKKNIVIHFSESNVKEKEIQ